MMKNNLMKQLLSIVISISILSQGLMANVTTTPEQDREEFIEYLQSQQEIYKAEFDKEMILESLDYDVDKIIDFVSNKIVYQAYDGILRGVEGTLIGRAGNAHDQALTLASMLNDADVEAQIMVGELNDSQIEELNQQISSPDLPTLAPIDKSQLPGIMKEMVETVVSLKSISEKKSIEVYKENNKIAKHIYKNIPKEALNKGAIAFKKELHDSTKSYRWVRYRTSMSTPWREVHPVYTQAKTWHLASSSIESGSVNEKDVQKLSMEMWIETSNGKKKSVTGKWEAPAANLTEKPLSIEIVSDALMKLDYNKDIGEQLKKSHFFFVRINNALPKEGKVFDLKGNIYDGSSVEALASVFATTGAKISEVTDLFSNTLSIKASKKHKKSYITKVWLEFIIKKPKTPATKIKRVLFERETLSNPSNIAITLLQGWDISIVTTNAMTQLHQENKISQSLEEVKYLEKIKTNIDKVSLKNIMGILPNRALVQLTHIRSQFDKVRFPNTISYHNEINILALRRGFISAGSNLNMYMATDIISSQRLSFSKNKYTLTTDIETSIRHGVWETYAEKSRIRTEKHVSSIKSAFDTLRSKNNPIIKINSFNPLLSKKLEESWWKVDEKTGNTIGMKKINHINGGISYTEAMSLLVLVPTMIISSSFFFQGTEDCLSKGGNTSCCLGINGSLWLAAIAGGEVVASVAATGTAVVIMATSGITGIASIGFDFASSQFIDVTSFCKGTGSLVPALD